MRYMAVTRPMTPQQLYEWDQRRRAPVRYPDVMRPDGETPRTPQEEHEHLRILRRFAEPLTNPLG